MEISGTTKTITKRRKQFSACDACRKSKKRCDGQTPCARCSRTGKNCEYSFLNSNTYKPPENQLRLSFRPQPGTQSTITAPRVKYTNLVIPTREPKMLCQTVHKRYLETYCTLINPSQWIWHGIDTKTFTELTTPENKLQYFAALASAARAFGENVAYRNYETQAVGIAKDLFTQISLEAAQGFSLLAYHYWGEDTSMASHYRSIALSMCKQLRNTRRIPPKEHEPNQAFLEKLIRVELATIACYDINDRETEMFSHMLRRRMREFLVSAGDAPLERTSETFVPIKRATMHDLLKFYEFRRMFAENILEYVYLQPEPCPFKRVSPAMRANLLDRIQTLRTLLYDLFAEDPHHALLESGLRGFQMVILFASGEVSQSLIEVEHLQEVFRDSGAHLGAVGPFLIPTLHYSFLVCLYQQRFSWANNFLQFLHKVSLYLPSVRQLYRENLRYFQTQCTSPSSVQLSSQNGYSHQDAPSGAQYTHPHPPPLMVTTNVLSPTSNVTQSSHQGSHQSPAYPSQQQQPNYHSPSSHYNQSSGVPLDSSGHRTDFHTNSELLNMGLNSDLNSLPSLPFFSLLGSNAANSLSQVEVLPDEYSERNIQSPPSVGANSNSSQSKHSSQSSSPNRSSPSSTPEALASPLNQQLSTMNVNSNSNPSSTIQYANANSPSSQSSGGSPQYTQPQPPPPLPSQRSPTITGGSPTSYPHPMDPSNLNSMNQQQSQSGPSSWGGIQSSSSPCWPFASQSSPPAQGDSQSSNQSLNLTGTGFSHHLQHDQNQYPQHQHHQHHHHSRWIPVDQPSPDSYGRMNSNSPVPARTVNSKSPKSEINSSEGVLSEMDSRSENFVTFDAVSDPAGGNSAGEQAPLFQFVGNPGPSRVNLGEINTELEDILALLM